MYFAVELCILLRNYMYAAAELNFHIVEGGGEWLTLNWYMTLKGTYFYLLLARTASYSGPHSMPFDLACCSYTPRINQRLRGFWLTR